MEFKKITNDYEEHEKYSYSGRSNSYKKHSYKVVCNKQDKKIMLATQKTKQNDAAMQERKSIHVAPRSGSIGGIW